MKSKRTVFSIIPLFSILIFGFTFIIFKKSISKADEDGFIKQIEFSEIKKIENRTSIKINYKLSPVTPNLKINSEQINNIDIEQLKKELGDDLVETNMKKNEISINLKNNIHPTGDGQFKLELLSQSETHLVFMDADNKKIFSESVNTIDTPNTEEKEIDSVKENESEVEQKTTPDSNAKINDKDSKRENDSSESTDVQEKNNDESIDNETAEEIARADVDEDKAGWQSEKTLRVTPGKSYDFADGKIATPVIYFGAINYALSNIKVIDSVGGRPVGFIIAKGNGRKNNITGPNSAVIVTPKGGNLYEEQAANRKDEKNIWLTQTFGDGRVNDRSNQKTELFGAQRNFTTTNLYDYNTSSHDRTRPNMIGPDMEKIDGNDRIAMIEDSARFYTKVDQETGLIMQRVSYIQEDPKLKFKIRTTITQKFLPDGNIKVTSTFRNLGQKAFADFQGYAFRDISFMANHDYAHIEKNNILRSLGNNKGIYATRAAYGGGIEFQMNQYDDAPYAWAARGTRSTYFNSTRGSGQYFPFKQNVLWGKPDAFTNVDDVGDNSLELDPGFGKRWLGKENDPNWDSGVSMHTKNQRLEPSESVSMSYMTGFVRETKGPNIKIDQFGTKEKPLLIDPNLKDFELTGYWTDGSSQKDKIKYLVEDATTENNGDIQKDGSELTQDFMTQSDQEQKRQARHQWSTKIDTKSLKAGKKYSIKAILINSEGKISPIDQVVIEKPSSATSKPQIKIESPISDSSESNPFNPILDELKLSGYWTDSDSEFLNISYQIDDGDFKMLYEHAKNDLHQLMPWELNKINLTKLNPDDLHKITLKIEDESQQSDTNTFWFKRSEGKISLKIPRDFDFGKHNMNDNSEVKSHTTFKGKLLIQDRRKTNSEPAKLRLRIGDFTLIDEDPNNDGDPNDEYHKSTLDNTIYWKGISSKTRNNLIIKDDIVPKPNQWVTTTDISQEFADGMEMSFTKPKNINNGSYLSHWYWDVIESL